MSKVGKEKAPATAPTSKAIPKDGKASKGNAKSKDDTTSKGKGDVGDGSGKGKMGMGQDKKTKGDKMETKKTMEKPVKKVKSNDMADKTRNMEASKRRQLRSLPQ